MKSAEISSPGLTPAQEAILRKGVLHLVGDLTAHALQNKETARHNPVQYLHACLYRSQGGMTLSMGQLSEFLEFCTTPSPNVLLHTLLLSMPDSVNPSGIGGRWDPMDDRWRSLCFKAADVIGSVFGTEEGLQDAVDSCRQTSMAHLAAHMAYSKHLLSRLKQQASVVVVHSLLDSSVGPDGCYEVPFRDVDDHPKGGNILRYHLEELAWLFRGVKTVTKWKLCCVDATEAAASGTPTPVRKFLDSVQCSNRMNQDLLSHVEYVNVFSSAAAANDDGGESGGVAPATDVATALTGDERVKGHDVYCFVPTSLEYHLGVLGHFICGCAPESKHKFALQKQQGNPPQDQKVFNLLLAKSIFSSIADQQKADNNFFIFSPVMGVKGQTLQAVAASELIPHTHESSEVETQVRVWGAAALEAAKNDGSLAGQSRVHVPRMSRVRYSTAERKVKLINNIATFDTVTFADADVSDQQQQQPPDAANQQQGSVSGIGGGGQQQQQPGGGAGSPLDEPLTWKEIFSEMTVDKFMYLHSPGHDVSKLLNLSFIELFQRSTKIRSERVGNGGGGPEDTLAAGGAETAGAAAGTSGGAEGGTASAAEQLKPPVELPYFCPEMIAQLRPWEEEREQKALKAKQEQEAAESNKKPEPTGKKRRGE